MAEIDTQNSHDDNDEPALSPKHGNSQSSANNQAVVQAKPTQQRANL